MDGFCASLVIAAFYVENESSASLQRPELFRLLSDCRPGDVLLTEQVDRLSRLTTEDWEKLKREIKDRQVKVVALDLPTSHMMIRDEDAFTGRMFEAVNGMLLDMLAAIARKDYDESPPPEPQWRKWHRKLALPRMRNKVLGNLLYVAMLKGALTPLKKS